MNEEKMIELQMQVRQNQQEMMDYLKELEGWEEDIKHKEAELKKKPVTTSDEKLPPVRNSLLKKKKKKKKLVSNDSISEKPKRLHGYDYRAWDKFDVEKACEQVDEEEKVSSCESETDEEWEEERRKQQADQLKEEGNQCFKDGKYAEAIDCYTRGLNFDSQNALLYANRAMALIKEKRHAAAELDCTEAITLDPTYIKAYARRATARSALKKYEDARDDYRLVLKLEPNNKQAKKELELVEHILCQFSMAGEASTVNEVGVVKPIYKSPAERSKAPLRRIRIEEYGVDVTTPSSTMQNAVPPAVRRDFEEFNSKFVSPTSDRNTATGSSQIDGVVNTDIDNNGRTKVESLASNDSGQNSDIIPSSPADIKVVPDLPSKESSSKVCCTLSIPTTSFQFQADWKILKQRKEEFYDYFKKINPEVYQQVFGEAFDAEMFSTIIYVLNTYYTRDNLDVYPVLKHLVNVKRFSMIIMFLSDKDKLVLKQVFRHVSSSNQWTTDVIESLQKCYEL